jgi:hypothetical protein
LRNVAHNLLIICALLASPLAAAAQEEHLNQYMLAAQHDWGTKRGFILILDNRYTNTAPSRLGTLRLALGVADGTDWRFINSPAEWEMGRAYTARAVIAPQKAELYLDGKLIGQMDVKLVPHVAPLVAGSAPGWGFGPAEYWITQTSVKLSTRGGAGQDVNIPASDLPMELALLQPPAGVQTEFGPAGVTTITAGFRVDRILPVEKIPPIIDRYGQAVAADWPDKVRSDDDLVRALADEQKRLAEWGDPDGYDRFGGSTRLGWTEQATGFYRIAKRDGFWWLITPEGNPCFYRGICTAPALAWDATPVTGRENLFAWLPPQEGLDAGAWRTNAWTRSEESAVRYACAHTPNLIRKYGPDYVARATQSTLDRARVFGFSGLAKWCDSDAQTPRIPVLGLWAVPRLHRHPDVFDPAIRQRIEQVLREQVEPKRDDPYIIGWSCGNEYDAMIDASDVNAALAKGADVPAKKALVDRALSDLYGGDVKKLSAAWKLSATRADDLFAATPQPPAADVEALRQFWADRHLELIYRTVKAVDPNHLYMGNWVTPNWWVNENDWNLVARHCDVMGYDQYSLAFAAEPARRLFRQIDKPVLLGEFSFPPDYDGRRGYGRYGTYLHSEEEVGDTYARYLADAASDPSCIGVCWFQYRDQPLTGRGPVMGPAAVVHGEHFAFGLVDVTDRPKWSIVERMRAANLATTDQRQRAMAGR